MNSHLNLFKTYAKKERAFQLENDLTRALAICLQEDHLFLHEVLTLILRKKNLYTTLFDDYSEGENIEIDIQKQSSQITGFEHFVAVSLSEHKMDVDAFWNAKHKKEYDPVCDIFIQFKNVAIVFEVKRDSVDCTSQLFNQAYNVILNGENEKELIGEKMKEQVIPVDLSWPELMTKTLNISNFCRALNLQTRFLKDFITLVEQHNYNWLPEPPISSLSRDKPYQIRRRINSAVAELAIQLGYPKLEKANNRIGLDNFPHGWAAEVLFSVIEEKGDLVVAIYPGNTKRQGWSLFHTEPKFYDTIAVKGEKLNVQTLYHIKFTSWQSYFTGLWFREDKLTERAVLYTKDNFVKYTGRKKRDTWPGIADLFDQHLNFDWKQECEWERKVVDSGKTQFDISFGYKKSVIVPFAKLQELDTNKDDLSELVDYLKTIFVQFRDKLLA